MGALAPPRFRISVGLRFVVVEFEGEGVCFFLLGRDSGMEGTIEELSTRVVVLLNVFIEGSRHTIIKL